MHPDPLDLLGESPDAKAACGEYVTVVASRSLARIRSADRLVITGDEGNFVLAGDGTKVHGRIAFKHSCRGSVVVLGERCQGTVKILVQGSSSLVMLGARAKLRDLQIRSTQPMDRILIGSDFSNTDMCAIVSGLGTAGGSGERPFLVLGDDCMLSFGVMIRNTDAHPIIEVATGKVLNEPGKGVVIEPHVWLGQDSAVLKGVTVGACSVVGMKGLVTRDVPRFSVASGMPAKSRPADGVVWARSSLKMHVESALRWHARFCTDGGARSVSAGNGDPEGLAAPEVPSGAARSG